MVKVKYLLKIYLHIRQTFENNIWFSLDMLIFIYLYLYLCGVRERVKNTVGSVKKISMRLKLTCK